MQKSDFLQPSVERTLNQMNFIDRYKTLSTEFSIKNNAFKCEPTEIVEVLKAFGITTHLSNDDQFFTDFEEVEGFRFRFGVTIKYNIVEFDSTFINEELQIKSGGSWGLIVQLMTNWSLTLAKPGFSSQEQMFSLLREGARLQNDIKTEILRLRGPTDDQEL